jgi:hypothetical protein
VTALGVLIPSALVCLAVMAFCLQRHPGTYRRLAKSLWRLLGAFWRYMVSEPGREPVPERKAREAASGGRHPAPRHKAARQSQRIDLTEEEVFRRFADIVEAERADDGSGR